MCYRAVYIAGRFSKKATFIGNGGASLDKKTWFCWHNRGDADTMFFRTYSARCTQNSFVSRKPQPGRRRGQRARVNMLAGANGAATTRDGCDEHVCHAACALETFFAPFVRRLCLDVPLSQSLSAWIVFSCSNVRRHLGLRAREHGRDRHVSPARLAQTQIGSRVQFQNPRRAKLPRQIRLERRATAFVATTQRRSSAGDRDGS